VTFRLHGPELVQVREVREMLVLNFRTGCCAIPHATRARSYNAVSYEQTGPEKMIEGVTPEKIVECDDLEGIWAGETTINQSRKEAGGTMNDASALPDGDRLMRIKRSGESHADVGQDGPAHDRRRAAAVSQDSRDSADSNGRMLQRVSKEPRKEGTCTCAYSDKTEAGIFAPGIGLSNGPRNLRRALAHAYQGSGGGKGAATRRGTGKGVGGATRAEIIAGSCRAPD